MYLDLSTEMRCKLVVTKKARRVWRDDVSIWVSIYLDASREMRCILVVMRGSLLSRLRQRSRQLS